jgi:hypothetical protein
VTCLTLKRAKICNSSGAYNYGEVSMAMIVAGPLTLVIATSGKPWR